MGHYYAKDGTPVYKDDQGRDTGIRYARDNNLAIGCTTICNMLASYNLTNWHVDKAIEAAKAVAFIDYSFGEEDIEIYQCEAKEKYKEYSTIDRDEGTKGHDYIETALKGGEWPKDTHHWYLMVTAAVAESQRLCGKDLISELPVAGKEGYGCKIDCHTREGDGVIVDYKFKNISDPAKWKNLRTYESHWMQLAANRMALGLPKADCHIMYINRAMPGEFKTVQVKEEQLEKGWTIFCHLLEVWKIMNNHRPEF